MRHVQWYILCPISFQSHSHLIYADTTVCLLAGPYQLVMTGDRCSVILLSIVTVVKCVECAVTMTVMFCVNVLRSLCFV